MPYAAIPTVSLAVGQLADRVTVDHAFTEFIIELLKVGSTRSHCFFSIREQPNGKAESKYPRKCGNVKYELQEVVGIHRPAQFLGHLVEATLAESPQPHNRPQHHGNQRRSD